MKKSRLPQHNALTQMIHWLIVTSFLLSSLSPALNPTAQPRPVHAQDTPLAAGTSANQTPLVAHEPAADDYEVLFKTTYRKVDTFNTSFDGKCDTLYIPGSDRQGPPAVANNLSTIRDMDMIIYNSYQWRDSDGAFLEIYQNNAVPGDVIVNIAGSVPAIASPDVNDLLENLYDEHGKIGSDYLDMSRQSLIDAIIFHYIPNNSHIIFTGHSQGGNVVQLLTLEANDPNTFLHDLMEARGITVKGGYAVASRPHGLIHALNAFQEQENGLYYFIYTAERDDEVPTLFSPFTIGPQVYQDNWFLDAPQAIAIIVESSVNAGLGQIQYNALVQKLMAFLGADFGNDPSSPLLNADLVQERVHNYFNDGRRTDFTAHGGSYADPFVHTYTQAQGFLQSSAVFKGDFPSLASLAQYYPGYTLPTVPFSLTYVGGYGFDCRAAVVYTSEQAAFEHQCIDPPPTPTGDPFNPVIDPAPYANPNAPSKQPDGVPDTMWINPDFAAKDNRRDTGHLAKEAAIRFWVNAGMPGDLTPQGAWHDRFDDFHQEEIRNNPDLPVAQRVIWNREFIYTLKPDGTPVPFDPNCPPPPPPGGPGGPGGGLPGGSPDDYNAPWTFQPTDVLSDDYLNNLVADNSLEPFSPAWSEKLQTAVAPRLALARQQNLSAARSYLQYLTALAKFSVELPTLMATLTDPADLARYQAAQIAESDTNDAMTYELVEGKRDGAPATPEEITAYWQDVLANHPDELAWQASPIGQRYAAIVAPFQSADEAFQALSESLGPQGLETAVAQQIITIERQVSHQGVGILNAGLVNWTQAAMAYAGVHAETVDIEQDSPYLAPTVLIVPSSALGRFSHSTWLRTWLSEYTRTGGHLIVLAQAHGADWQMLPGGEVDGLGFEEDIFCREDSVTVLTNNFYLAGIREELPDLQLDGSFTQYPANAIPLLQRRTGNQMPAMILYPYGQGTVLATSLYPDFSAINGLQTADDVVFMRSFFLEAWRQATGDPILFASSGNEDVSFSIPVTNDTASPASATQIKSDIALSGPESWRYNVHYESGGQFGLHPVGNEVVLSPPLQPGSTRLVDTTLHINDIAGLHRLSIGGIPGPLYAVDIPFIFASSFVFFASSNDSAYWSDEVASVTAVLSPTAALTQTFPLTLTAVTFPNLAIPVTLQPGQVATATFPLALTDSLIGRPITLQAFDSQSNQVAFFRLPVRINQRPATARLQPNTQANLYWVGDTIAVTGNLLATPYLLTTADFRLQSLDFPAFPSQTGTLAPSGQASFTANIVATEALTAVGATIHLEARNSANEQRMASAQLPLRVIPLPSAHLRFDVGSPSGLNLPLTLFNSGGYGTNYTANVELHDPLGRIVTTATLNGAIDRAAATSHTPATVNHTLVLPDSLAAGAYTLHYTISGDNSQTWQGVDGFLLTDVNADLLARTEQVTYLPSDVITAVNQITVSAPIADSWLRLQVYTGEGATIQNFTPNNSPLADNLVTAVAIEPSGDIWLATASSDGYGGTNPTAIQRLSANLSTWLSVPLPFSSGYNGITDLAIDINTDLWATTDGDGVGLLDIGGGGTLGVGTWITYTQSNSGLGSNYARAVAFDSSGNTWIGTSYGLYRRTPSNIWTAYTTSNSGLSNNDILAVAVDANDTVWVGTNGGGLNKLTSGNVWSTYTTSNSGILGNIIRHITFDAAGDGWLAVLYGGVSVLHTNNTWSNYTPSNSGLFNNYPTHIEIDATGRKWIGDEYQGISLLSADNTTWEHLGIAEGLSDEAVYDLAASSSGDMWAGFDWYNGNGGASRINLSIGTTLLREEWVPVTSNGTSTIPYAFNNPILGSDSRARGELALVGTLFGPEPSATAVITEHQILATSFSHFIISPDSVTLNLVADNTLFRTDGSTILRGTVLNQTGSTGVTLEVYQDSNFITTVPLPTLAPGATTDFALSVSPLSPGEHSYLVREPNSGAEDSTKVTAVDPALQIGSVGGDNGTTLPAGSVIHLTLPVSNNSDVVGFVTLTSPNTPATALTIQPSSTLTVALQIPTALDAPAGTLNIPLTFSGDVNTTLNASVTLTNDAPPVVAPPSDPTAGIPGRADVLTAVLLDPQPVSPGQTVVLQATLQATVFGRQALTITGFDDQRQRPLTLDTVGATLVVTDSLTIPATLPGGTYNVVLEAGGDSFILPVTVANWQAKMALNLSTTSPADGEALTASVTVSETGGFAAPLDITVRYGTDPDSYEQTQSVLLAANGTATLDFPLVADLYANRVTAFVNAQQIGTDPGYAPLIDSKPLNVHPTGSAYVTLDLPSLRATAGMTVTGEFIITDPISNARLELPQVLNGRQLFLADVLSSNVLTATGSPFYVDLNQTPTGTWPFSFVLAPDLPSGRYALDFTVNGLYQPVVFDVDGAGITASIVELDDSAFPTVTLTIDLESQTTLPITPFVSFRGLGLVSSPDTLNVQAGKQTVQVTAVFPDWATGVGPLQVQFFNQVGQTMGATDTHYQVGTAAIVEADLLGTSLLAPAEVVLTLAGNGPVELVYYADDTPMITTTTTLTGYETLSQTLPPLGSTELVKVKLTDSYGTAVWAILGVNIYLQDTVAPVITLNDPGAVIQTATVAQVLLTGTAQDSGSGVCQLLVAGQQPSLGANGQYTTTVTLTPGQTATSYALQATARDCNGNTSLSPSYTLEVQRIVPQVALNATAVTVNETDGQAVITVSLSMFSSLTTTIHIQTADGTATAGADYQALAETLVFPPYAQALTVTIPITADGFSEGTETFTVLLSNPSNGQLGTITSTTVTIVDAVSDFTIWLPVAKRP